MARREARLKTRIWDDDDFLALDRPEQLAYLFLISQPDISHNGVLPLRLKRWAKKLKYTTGQLEKVLFGLEQKRFIVVDDEEEELLVRSFLRNDEVYKQPKVLLAAMRQLDEIASAKIRGELSREIERVLGEGMAGENTRPTLLKMLGTLGRALRGALGIAPEAKPQVNTLSDTQPDTPSEGYGEGIREGFPVPNAMGTGVGVGVGEGFEVVGNSSSSPSGEAHEDTSNEDQDQASTDADALDSEKTSKAKAEPKRGTRIPLPFDVTEDMQDWAKRKAPLAFGDLDYQTEQFVDYWKARTGQIAIKLDWPATWMSWMRKAQKDLSDKAKRFATPQGPASTAPKLLDDSEKCEHRKRASACGLCRVAKMGAPNAA